MTGLRLVPSAVSKLVRLPHRTARALLLRDFDTWLRFEFLGVAAQTGLARAVTSGSRTVGDFCAVLVLSDGP